MKSLSRPRLLATPRTAAYQAPPSMGFSRQEYWSGVPLPSLRQININRINIFKKSSLREGAHHSLHFYPIILSYFLHSFLTLNIFYFIF